MSKKKCPIKSKAGCGSKRSTISVLSSVESDRYSLDPHKYKVILSVDMILPAKVVDEIRPKRLTKKETIELLKKYAWE